LPFHQHKKANFFDLSVYSELSEYGDSSDLSVFIKMELTLKGVKLGNVDLDQFFWVGRAQSMQDCR